MPVHRKGKTRWAIGRGPGHYRSRAAAQRAQRAMYAKRAR